MAGSVTEICNMALAHLRAGDITSIDDQTPEGRNCKKFYQQSLDETLRAVDWNFARTFANGVPLAGVTLAPGWGAAFAYPNDCAALRGIARRCQTENPRNYMISQASGSRIIYANVSAPVFVYTSKATPISAYDDMFISALTYILASKIAIPITGNAEMMSGMQQMARGMLARASADNYNEEPETLEDPVPDWLAVRGVVSMTRDQRAAAWGGRDAQPAGLYALPGQLQANPVPPMVTGPGPGSLVLPAYVPGLTAPVPPPEPILGTDEIYLHSVGGELMADGSLSVDVPPGTVDRSGLDGEF